MRYRVAKEYAPLTHEKAPVAGGISATLLITLPATQRCQLDHLVEYPKGKTEHCNGACECVHHHQAKHASMTVTRLDNGTMRWTNRFGITRTRPPRPLLRGW